MDPEATAMQPEATTLIVEEQLDELGNNSVVELELLRSGL